MTKSPLSYVVSVLGCEAGEDGREGCCDGEDEDAAELRVDLVAGIAMREGIASLGIWWTEGRGQRCKMGSGCWEVGGEGDDGR